MKSTTKRMIIQPKKELKISEIGTCDFCLERVTSKKIGWCGELIEKVKETKSRLLYESVKDLSCQWFDVIVGEKEKVIYSVICIDCIKQMYEQI